MKTPAKIPSQIIDRAYDQLPDWDKMLVEHQVLRLMRIRNVGPIVGLEILAHLGLLLEEASNE